MPHKAPISYLIGLVVCAAAIISALVAALAAMVDATMYPQVLEKFASYGLPLLFALSFSALYIYLYRSCRKTYAEASKRFVLVLSVLLVLLGSALITTTAYLAFFPNSRLASKLERLIFEKHYSIQIDTIDISRTLPNIEAAIKDARHVQGDFYIQNGFSIYSDLSGTLSSLDGVLYIQTGSGGRAFMLSYDASKGEDISVLEFPLDSSFDTREVQRIAYAEDSLQTELAPENLSKLRASNELSTPLLSAERLHLMYLGQGQTDPGIQVLQDGALKSASTSSVSGYLWQLDSQDEDGQVLLTSFIASDLKLVEARATQTQQTQTGLQDLAENSYSVDQGHDLTYRYLGLSAYRLHVVDAAAGSYAYRLEYSADFGKNWKTLNNAPFGSEEGAASEMYVADEQTLFYTLAYSGGDASSLYTSFDGGATSTKIELPYQEVRSISGELEAATGTSDVSAYDYVHVPAPDSAGNLVIVATPDAFTSDGLRFISKDGGKSWHVDAA